MANERNFISLRNSLNALKLNKDFQNLIEKDYFIVEALEAVSDFNKPHIVNGGLRPFVLEKITGINMLKSYFDMIEDMAQNQEEIEKENLNDKE